MLQTKFLGNQSAGAGVEDFIYLYLKAFIQNLVQKGIVVSEKIQFEFLYVRLYTTLGHGQEMNLTFNTHIPS